jgi:hypothetical protein
LGPGGEPRRPLSLEQIFRTPSSVSNENWSTIAAQ